MAEELELKREEDKIQLGMMLQSINDIKSDIKEIKEESKQFYTKDDAKEVKDKLDKVKDTFVTRVEFMPVKNIIFGMMALFATSIVIAILKLVIVK